MTQIDRRRIAAVHKAESERFAREHPRSRELFERARGSLVSGVPMTWMAKWVGGHPVYAASAHGATIEDVDGKAMSTSRSATPRAMAGHSPPATVAAVARRFGEQGGATLMLPTEDAAWVGEELGRRFGVPLWSFALTATDANRWALRLCRALTERPYVLVFSHCYHGSVDETFVTLEGGTAAVAPGQRRPCRRSDAHDARVRVQRPRGRRAPARRRSGGLRARRARSHEHRHRPARAGLPRRAARGLRPRRGRC